MMGRLEKRYCWIMDILAWGHRKYTEEQLEKLTMPELAEIHSQVYHQHLDEIQSIHRFFEKAGYAKSPVSEISAARLLVLRQAKPGLPARTAAGLSRILGDAAGMGQGKLPDL